MDYWDHQGNLSTEIKEFMLRLRDKEQTMTTCDGVYILKSPVHVNVGDFEYRVAYVVGLQRTLYYDRTDTERLKEYFGKCHLLYSRGMALMEADEIAQKYETLEYGIQVITIPFCFPK